MARYQLRNNNNIYMYRSMFVSSCIGFPKYYIKSMITDNFNGLRWSAMVTNPGVQSSRHLKRYFIDNIIAIN